MTNAVELISSTFGGYSSTSDYYTGQWDVDTNFATFAHEASHLLGLGDSYVDSTDITYSAGATRSENAGPTPADIANAIRNNPSW